MAVKSPDLKGLHFLSLQVEVADAGTAPRRWRTAGGPWLGLPVWAISESVWQGGDGLIMAANRSARRITSWPDAHDYSAQINEANHNVGEAMACQLT